jgi:hypothetical protein
MATDALFMLSIGIAVAVLLATPPQPTTEEAREMRNGPWQRQRLQAWLLATIPLFCLTISTKAQNPTVQDNRSVPANDSTRKSLADFDHFLDNHPEIAEQVRKDPSLLDKRQFVQSHPALETYLAKNPGVRDDIQRNPSAFVYEEDRFDRDRNVGDRNDPRGSVAEFDRFLDGHREIAEQVRRDPSLLKNRQFVQSHPALGGYLDNNPGVRDDIRRDPSAFMRQEDQFEHAQNGDRDFNRDHLARFGAFLGGHSNIAREVSENPDRVRDQQYVDSHGELKAYLHDNPDVREDLMANPSGFVKGAQQFNSGATGTNGSGAMTGAGAPGATCTKGSSSSTPTPAPTPTTPAPKPKQ